jgi:hypothetical protein
MAAPRSRRNRTDSDPLSLVRAARGVQDQADDLLTTAVHQARESGCTWQEIGDVLGVTRQAAFQRYGKPIDPRTGAAEGDPSGGPVAMRLGVGGSWSTVGRTRLG